MILVSDAIRACVGDICGSLVGDPSTEAEFNKAFTDNDPDNPLTWAVVKAKLDELNQKDDWSEYLIYPKPDLR